MNRKLTLGVGAALIAAFLLGALVVAYSAAQPTDRSDAPALSEAPSPFETPPPPETSFSELQEDEIRALVHDYLMRNPEVIIDAVNAYSRRQQALAAEHATKTAKERLGALLDPTHGFVAAKDPAKAKVAVIELFDYHCGYCKRATPMIRDLTKGDPDVKVVFREFPILRDESDIAAEYALAAREQKKFLDLHFALMDASGVLNEKRIKDIAKKQGLDLARLEKARQDPTVSEAILETIDIARDLGVEGTPAFIIASLDGDFVDVIQGYDPDGLTNAIDAAKKASKRAAK